METNDANDPTASITPAKKGSRTAVLAGAVLACVGLAIAIGLLIAGQH